MALQVEDQVRGQLAGAVVRGLAAAERGVVFRGAGGEEVGDLLRGEAGVVTAAGGVGWGGLECEERGGG